MATKIEKEIGDMIEKNVDFDSIVHSSPDILRDPVCIRLEVIRTLKNNGLVVYDNPYGSFRKSVMLKCSDTNGTYYMFCDIVRSNRNPELFVISVGNLYKAAEKIDPFSPENDVKLSSEQVETMNKEYINTVLSK